jgi:hypothetical protein
MCRFRSGNLFFKIDIQNSAIEIFFEQTCPAGDSDSFPERFFILDYGHGKACFFKINPYLFFHQTGKINADMDIPVFFSYTDWRIESILKNLMLIHVFQSPFLNSCLQVRFGFPHEFSILPPALRRP